MGVFLLFVDRVGKNHLKKSEEKIKGQGKRKISIY